MSFSFHQILIFIFRLLEKVLHMQYLIFCVPNPNLYYSVSQYLILYVQILSVMLLNLLISKKKLFQRIISNRENLKFGTKWRITLPLNTNITTVCEGDSGVSGGRLLGLSPPEPVWNLLISGGFHAPMDAEPPWKEKKWSPSLDQYLNTPLEGRIHFSELIKKNWTQIF